MIKTGEHFQVQQRHIGRAGNAALRCPVEPTSGEHFPGDPFMDVANGFHANFVAALGEMENTDEVIEKLKRGPAVAFGYRVMARMICETSKAYIEFCEKDNRIGSMSELVDLLKSDQAYDEFPGYISDMPRNFAAAFEEPYGLTDTSYEPGMLHFAVGSREQDGREILFVYPRDELEGAAIALTPDWATKPEYGEFARCPAREVLLPSLWPEMIDACKPIFEEQLEASQAS